MHNYDWLISRLDFFIRKYYANRVIRGSLLFLACVVSFVLVISLGEYFLYFRPWVKLMLLTLFGGGGLFFLTSLVLFPLLQMWKLRKTINREQAAVIIGQHFPEISDQLLNILQLKQSPSDQSSRDLAEAGINQKIQNISVVPIQNAVDLSANRKYLKYLAPPVFICVLLLVAAPRVFTESSERLLRPTTTFKKPAPFQFHILNPTLIATKGADYTLRISITGSQLPAEVSLIEGPNNYGMESLPEHQYNVTLRKPQQDIRFTLSAGGYTSDEYTLKVVQPPLLKSFDVKLLYPGCTGRKSESARSLGDLNIPVGTTVSLGMLTEYTDSVRIILGNGKAFPMPKVGNIFAFQYRFLNDTNFTIVLNNSESPIADSLHYNVQVIPDQYPVVQVEQFKDTVTGKQIVLRGTAGDDYGISRVLFKLDVTDGKKTIKKHEIPLPVSAGVLTAFQYYLDLETLDLQAGQKASYYVEAWDNDCVHGSKATRSETMTFEMYSKTQTDSAINENAQQINSGISTSVQQDKQMQQDINDLQTKMLDKNGMDWEQKQNLQQMMTKEMEMKNQVENIKKRFEEQQKETEKKEYSDAVKEKQQDLKKQLDNMLNQELKEALKKLQDMMAKLNKEQAVEAMKQVEQDNKLFKMDMERLDALMKKLELQMRMEDMAGKMDELAKKQDELAQKTEEGKNDQQELSKEQKELKNELDKALKDEMKEMEKLAKESKEEKALDKPKDAGQEAQNEMKESEKQLAQKQNSKSSKAQKKASQKMNEMAKNLREESAGMDMDQVDIDIKATRQILSNLIHLSFDQEDLMDAVRKTSASSQAYVRNQEEQNRLHRNSYMIRDSLFALGKRVSKLSSGINKETTELEHNMQLAVDELENRNIGAAITRQQYVMTHTNNLALNLNELLANLMQMQNPGMAGSAGSCSKPGGSMPKPGGKQPKPGAGDQLSDIITEQQQLGDAMQQRAGKKPGNKPGNKPGDKPGDKNGGKKGEGGKEGQGKNAKGGQQSGGSGGSGGNSGDGDQEGDNENGDAEQLARMAEQQSNLRRKIQELSSLLNSKGLNGNAKDLNELQQKMDKNETDLVNRRINTDLLMRQKDIITRLLETDKALRQQEQDDKRSSKTGTELSRPIPPQLQQYMGDKKQLLELYKTVPPQLKPYYKNMVDSYFQIIGSVPQSRN